MDTNYLFDICNTRVYIGTSIVTVLALYLLFFISDANSIFLKKLKMERTCHVRKFKGVECRDGFHVSLATHDKIM